MTKRITVIALVASLLLVALTSLTPAGASVSDLQGRELRPTTHPPEKPIEEEEAKDAQFALWVSFTAGWPALGLNWQDLWTVVEWQDDLGEWHEVISEDGTSAWEGTLDYIKDGKAWKVWWVDPPDYGKGPFRWLIYDKQGGEVLNITRTFYLPSGGNRRVIVETSIP